MLKTLTAAGVAASGFRLPLVHASNYRGKLFVFVQADGGWDPTSFCDPKANTPGEPVINHWPEDDEIRQAGNIPYAPFARNVAFFEKYHRRMLVINGVDAQTNSHTVGIVHNWSGRNSEGYPTTTALLAAHYAQDLPVPYLSFGGYSVTSGLTRFTRIDDANLLRDIANPATEMFTEEDWAEMESLRNATAERLKSQAGLLPGDMRHRAFYRSAFATEGLKAYADAIPLEDELERDQIHSGADRIFRSTLRRQAQLTVLAFKTGVAVGADLWLGGFDTHAFHDPDHEWAAGKPDRRSRLPVGLRGEAWRCQPHGGGNGLGLRAHELLQLRAGQGPLAHRQLRHHGEEPALDRPGGRRDRRGCTSPSASTRAPCATTTGAAPSSIPSTCTRPFADISASSTHREPSVSRSTTPKTSRSSAERRRLRSRAK